MKQGGNAGMMNGIVAAAFALALVVPAAAAGSFDGTYKGDQTAMGTNNSSLCANLTRSTMLVVQNNHFTRTWGEVTIPVDIAPDGSFAGSVSTTDSRKQRTIAIKGRITGDTLDADIGSPLCAAHLSLKKS